MIIIPAMVMAETMSIARKGCIPITFRETINKINQYENFQITPLDVDVLLIADSINIDVEMHDKLIIAATINYDAKLITKDQQIRNSKIVETI
jgi:PIN domain nuclease of toxin-antitoxin system